MINLELANVSKRYVHNTNSVTAVNNVTLKIKKEEVAAIIGPSGSGKTTLLCLAGLLLTPDKGKIKIAGQEVNFMSRNNLAKTRAQKIGFIFQNFNLLPYLSALDNVLIAMDVNGKPNKSKAVDVLTKVGLSKRLHHLPGELSGGEQQRVSIARALVNNPEILLADEPTGNLDQKTGNEIIDMLWNLNTQFAKSILIVTHDLAIAKKAHNTWHLVDGNLSLHK